MDEIVVDDGKVVAVIHRVEKLLAHANQCRGAAGREIQPAEQFQPARLAGAMSSAAASADGEPPGGDRGIDARRIVAERARQRLEKGDARPGRQLGIVGQEFRWRAQRRRPRRGRRAEPRRVPRCRRSGRGPVRGAREKARLRSAMLCSMSLKNEVFTATIASDHPLATIKYLIIAGGDDKPAKPYG